MPSIFCTSDFVGASRQPPCWARIAMTSLNSATTLARSTLYVSVSFSTKHSSFTDWKSKLKSASWMSSVLTVADSKLTLAGSDGEFQPDKRKSGDAMESSPDFLNVPTERGGMGSARVPRRWVFRK